MTGLTTELLKVARTKKNSVTVVATRLVTGYQAYYWYDTRLFGYSISTITEVPSIRRDMTPSGHFFLSYPIRHPITSWAGQSMSTTTVCLNTLIRKNA